MDVSEIFARLKQHALEGMVFHDCMVRYFDFLALDEHKGRHKCRYEEETEGYRKLCDYYMSHYNELIPEQPMNRPDVIPESWYRYSRMDVDSGTRNNAIRVASGKWVDWERETKTLYEEMCKELMDMGEIASAIFVSRMVKDVNHELAEAERHHIDLNK